jgi:hypothetical protein
MNAAKLQFKESWMDMNMKALIFKNWNNKYGIYLVTDRLSETFADNLLSEGIITSVPSLLIKHPEIDNYAIWQNQYELHKNDSPNELSKLQPSKDLAALFAE